MSNAAKSDKQHKRPDLVLMLYQSKANVSLISKKSKTWRLVVAGQGSDGYLQATYIGEERFLLPQLIPSP